MKTKFIMYIRIFLLFFFFSGVAQQNYATQKQRSAFADTQELTSSDYLSSIDRANELMNTVSDQGEFRGPVLRSFSEIDATNESLTVILENIRGASNTNVRNQRMYEKALVDLQNKLEKYEAELIAETAKIVGLKKHLRTSIKDTVFKKLVRDSIVRNQYKPQLAALRAKFFDTDSVLKQNLNILNTHKAENTRRKMVIADALVVVGDRLDKSGVAIFRSERPNLWDSGIKIEGQSISSFIAEKFVVERNAFTYYFNSTFGYTFLLLLFMALLYWWIRSNQNTLKAADKFSVLSDEFHFRALNNNPLLSVLVVGLNACIVVNIYAPALYIEFVHLLLLVALSFLFFKRWHPKTYTRWLFLVAVFIAFCFIDLFLKVTLLQRFLFIVINVVAIRFGLTHLKYIREELYIKVLFKWANYLFIGFNIAAILFNLFGRISLSYTLSLTAIIALTQMIALAVLLRIILEVIILQVFTTRVRRGLHKIFDYVKLEKNAQKPFLMLIVYMWIIVLASNLNLSESLLGISDNILHRQNIIGNFSFTFGGVLLFFLIIWIAHLLQQFVAFFFGGIDEEDEQNVNKRQYSKLLITRLLLLVCGYLLAIAASGMPLDKITIILGALGVGVGLGLQSIVSNFVSGVILIFERPIQIGDVIDSGGQSGRVKEINLRTTRIDTANGAEVIIPNANILSQNIVNWTYTDNYRLTTLSFTVRGELSKDEICETIVATLNTIPELNNEEVPQIFFESMTNEKSHIKVKFWCNVYRTEQAISEVRVELYQSFAKRNVAMDD